MAEDQEALRQTACHICGGRQFAWGDYQDAGFKPDGSPVMADWYKQRARYCERCGNLQVFTVWDTQAKPSVWDRIRGSS